jgi:hypothetical protein
LYIGAGLKNPWVCGHGYPNPKPMPTNPMGLTFNPIRPMGLETDPCPYPNGAKTHGFVGCGHPLPSLVTRPAPLLSLCRLRPRPPSFHMAGAVTCTETRARIAIYYYVIRERLWFTWLK